MNTIHESAEKEQRRLPKKEGKNVPPDHITKNRKSGILRTFCKVCVYSIKEGKFRMVKPYLLSTKV